ncbi:MAG: chemotaxis protein CheX [Candidatus Sulfotelmatobacter sp.]|jgi:chemotaxis protein CheX
MTPPPPPANDISAALPRSAWSAILSDTAIEVFATMVGAKVTAPEGGDFPVLAQVTGMIGVAGALRAVFSLRCSLLSATMIASQMLGVSPEEAAAQKCDAVGEICNIVAGYFKAKIGLGDKCMLSVPTVLAGNDYKIHSRSEDDRLEFPLLYESEPVWIALEIRP